VILHDLNLAAAYADTIGIMHAGRLVAYGRPQDVLTERTLSAAFECPIKVVRTLGTNHLLIVPDRTEELGRQAGLCRES
ncbi:MAG TPA: hemin ABC transporter ATP-binding protein, partial [Dehalococcoidia bacterium]|nr:hemin ABC transporter ATP-binding protein [Dehalococcoidia bacterium]